MLTFTLLISPSIGPPGESWWKPRGTAHSVLKTLRQMSKQRYNYRQTNLSSVAVNWQSPAHSYWGVWYVHVYAGVHVYLNMDTKGQPSCCPSRVIHLDLGNRFLTGLGLTDGVDWQSIDPQESTCLCPSSLGITNVDPTPSFLVWVLGIELRSSCRVNYLRTEWSPWPEKSRF